MGKVVTFMQDKEKFLELLQEAVRMAKAENREPTEEEVERWFQGMRLSQEQFRYINEYIKRELQGEEKERKKDAITKGASSKNHYVGAYLKEIRGFTPLTEAEKVKLYRSWLVGGEGAGEDVKNRLVEGNLSKVLAITRRFKSGIETEEDLLGEELIGEGNLALIQAVDGMRAQEPLRDAVSSDDKALFKKCETYIEKEVKKALTAYLEMEMGLSNWERSVVAKSALIHEAAKHLAKENGTLASVQELAQYVKMSEEEIRDVVKLSNGAIKIGESP